MKHLVYCWEIGSGLGHMVPLAALVRSMVAQGHKVTCVLKQTEHAPRLLGDIPGVTWMVAPRSVLREHRLKYLINHADILHNNGGFHHADVLVALLHAWRRIFSELRADRVICDFSPTARLAATTLGIDVVNVDSGFSMPPLPERDNAPVPGFCASSEVSDAALLISEERTLHVANNALNAIGAATVPSFAGLFSGQVWYRNWIEFNHFGHHAAELHLGQIFYRHGGELPVWPAGAAPKIFAYLRPDHPNSLPVLRAALARKYRVLAYLPGFDKASLAEFELNPLFKLSEQPLDLNRLPDDVAVSIWHSATGAVAHCLNNGMRMIFLPNHQEQKLACEALSRAGFSAYLVAREPIEHWDQVFDTVFALPRIAARRPFVFTDADGFAARLLQHI